MKNFKDLLQQMSEVHDKKANDYSKVSDKFSNFKFAATLANEFSDPVDRVFATLIGVKLGRLAELRNGKTALNESTLDSFLDLTNYAALWWLYAENNQPENIELLNVVTWNFDKEIDKIIRDASEVY